MQNTIQQTDKNIMNTYARNQIVLKRGKRAKLFDENNKEYIDFASGIGVNSLGYGNEKWCEAICNAANTLSHTSNLFYSEPASVLAFKLCNATHLQSVFFANSGAEANECAIKVARKYSFNKYGENRNTIITFKNSFHGRTITTLSATGQDSFHQFFNPFTEGFIYCDVNDSANLQKTIAENKGVCAIMFELTLGEGGVLDLDYDFVQNIKKIATENDILLIVDEVQTGVCRCGTFLLCEQYDLLPDILTLAKGLGGGLPIGACLCGEKTKNVLCQGQHGSTFGGNLVACSGANVVVDTLCKELSDIKEKSKYLREKLEEIDEISFLSGKGLMIGITLKNINVKELLLALSKNGLIALSAKDKLRLLPPLTISYEEIDEGLCILKNVIHKLIKQKINNRIVIKHAKPYKKHQLVTAVILLLKVKIYESFTKTS